MLDFNAPLLGPERSKCSLWQVFAKFAFALTLVFIFVRLKPNLAEIPVGPPPAGSVWGNGDALDKAKALAPTTCDLKKLSGDSGRTNLSPYANFKGAEQNPPKDAAVDITCGQTSCYFEKESKDCDASTNKKSNGENISVKCIDPTLNTYTPAKIYGSCDTLAEKYLPETVNYAQFYDDNHRATDKDDAWEKARDRTNSAKPVKKNSMCKNVNEAAMTHEFRQCIKEKDNWGTFKEGDETRDCIKNCWCDGWTLIADTPPNQPNGQLNLKITKAQMPEAARVSFTLKVAYDAGTKNLKIQGMMDDEYCTKKTK